MWYSIRFYGENQGPPQAASQSELTAFIPGQVISGEAHQELRKPHDDVPKTKSARSGSG